MKVKGGKLQANNVFIELVARLLALLARGCCGCRKLVKSTGGGSILKNQLRVKLTGQIRLGTAESIRSKCLH